MVCHNLSSYPQITLKNRTILKVDAKKLYNTGLLRLSVHLMRAQRYAHYRHIWMRKNRVSYRATSVRDERIELRSKLTVARGVDLWHVMMS
jgi:hypothetical protein